MTFIKSRYKIIFIAIICLVGLIIFLWYPRVENIQIIYPNYSFHTGQSITEIKNILGDTVNEPDNDGGKRNYRYISFNDIKTNPKIRIHLFLTFYKNHLVSFYCQFKSKDSTYDLTNWLKRQYSQIINSKDCKSYFKNEKFQYKLHKNNSFIHLAIDNAYREFSASTYLVGDYRYKEIDWDDD